MLDRNRTRILRLRGSPLRSVTIFISLIVGGGVLAPQAMSAEPPVGTAEFKENGMMQLRKLTPEEERVMVNKGTEQPFSGKYNDHYATGVYACRRCGAELYRSDDKFKSGCGWPSFDDEIAGAVRRETDADGRRTEILCVACGAHLGHVFADEGFTDKNQRHCVNSISLEFIPAGNAAAEAKDQAATRKAIFAGGCFWGVEYYMEAVDGVLDAVSGYIGGDKENPTYREVCNHQTGHAEAVEVTFDPSKVDYETLARTFFEIHDPTQLGRQGPDVGEQYRSAIFYLDEEQKEIAQRLIDTLKAKGFDVVTELRPATAFWPAEAYHQDYYVKKRGLPYCHRPVKRFD